MLIMTSIVRVGQSHFAAIPIDEDSRERIMNCIETLANLQTAKAATDIFLKDTRAAYTKMVANEEVGLTLDSLSHISLAHARPAVTEKSSGKEGEGQQEGCCSGGRCDSFPTICQKDADGWRRCKHKVIDR
jgi:vesicle coat complex subunit